MHHGQPPLDFVLEREQEEGDGFDDDVALRAGLAAVGRVGAGALALFGGTRRWLSPRRGPQGRAAGHHLAGLEGVLQVERLRSSACRWAMESVPCEIDVFVSSYEELTVHADASPPKFDKHDQSVRYNNGLSL